MEEKPKKKMPMGKRFEKGKSGNPSGRPIFTPEIVALRKVSKQTFEEKLQQFLHSPFSQVEDMLVNYREDGTNSIDMMVAAVIKGAVSSGCTMRLNFLLNRMGVTSKFEEHDPLTNVTPAEQAQISQNAAEEAAPFYVVEINRDGKFVRSRPRELRANEREVMAMPVTG